MNFPLKNFELHVDDNALVVGEQLFERGKVEDLQELERHLWSAQVEQNEVEVQITPAKVRAVTCECDEYQQQGICGHIVATLFVLRKRELARREKKIRQPIRQRRSSRLTTNAVLENASLEDLRGFIREYARQNPQFSIALKARFATQVPMADSFAKFSQVLDAAINKTRKKDDTLSKPGLAKLQKVLTELRGQVADSIALDNFSEAVVLLEAMIQKINPLLRKAGTHEDAFRELMKYLFEQVNLILTKPIAPSLKRDIWNFFLGESTKGTYRISGVLPDIFRLLLQLTDVAGNSDILFTNLDQHLQQANLSREGLAQILIIKLQLLEKLGRESEVHELLVENLGSEELLLFVVHQSLEKQNYDRAKFFAKNGLQQNHNRRTVSILEDSLLDIAELQKDVDSVLHYAESRFLATFDSKYFELLRTYATNDWQQRVAAISEKISALPYSTRQRDAFALVLAAEEKYADLLAYIEKIGSLDLLQKYDEVLFEVLPKETNRAYNSLIYKYLDNHFGRIPSERITQIIHHLRNIGRHKLVNKLLTDFRTNFRDRHSLLEELAVF